MQKELFDEQEYRELPGGGRLTFFRRWLQRGPAEDLMQHLLKDLEWEQPQIRVAGKRHKIPRMQAWHGYPGTGFRYSGVYFKPQPLDQSMLKVLDGLEKQCSARFNSVLVNLYRDQNDGVGWHADDEPEFGLRPQIASLSLGATRRFNFKPKPHFTAAAAWKKGQRALSFDLNHGDVVLMSDTVQSNWLHCVPKESRACQARVNLTFRLVVKNDTKTGTGKSF